MKIVIDQALCEGNGRCMEAAPEIFQVGDDDKAYLLTQAPSAALRDKLAQAVRMCPRRAITVVDE